MKIFSLPRVPHIPAVTCRQRLRDIIFSPDGTSIRRLCRNLPSTSFLYPGICFRDIFRFGTHSLPIFPIVFCISSIFSVRLCFLHICLIKISLCTSCPTIIRPFKIRRISAPVFPACFFIFCPAAAPVLKIHGIVCCFRKRQLVCRSPAHPDSFPAPEILFRKPVPAHFPDRFIPCSIMLSTHILAPSIFCPIPGYFLPPAFMFPIPLSHKLTSVREWRQGNPAGSSCI